MLIQLKYCIKKGGSMKKLDITKKIISSIIIFIIMILSLGQVYASSNNTLQAKSVEYTEEYKRYLELSDEEKAKTLEPNKYKVITGQSNTEYLKSLNNPLKVTQLLKATLSDNYSLQTVIPENVKIRDQMETNTCWAFASTAVLESNLAMLDKSNGMPTKTYDFSEKHMIYGSLRYAFLNNQKNPYGISTNVSDGGNFYMASMYLTNGSGAVAESDLPFENSEEKIDISQIKNKTVQTTLKDTVIFNSPTDEAEKQELMNQMKQHITNYGGIYAGVHGADILSECYNNETGAIYCNSHNSDHAVTIIGWDDNYSKDNFKEGNRPTSNGAWIIKNSWGDKIAEENVMELKQYIYDTNTSQCQEAGWNSASEIPNGFLISNLEREYGQGKIKIEGDMIIAELGNKGYMYLSYEDKNVYDNLTAIEKASSKKDYYKLYQNDELGWSNGIEFNKNHIYLANVFKRDSGEEELLNSVSISTMQEYDCKVYVNPNGTSKAKSDLEEVELKAGDSIRIKPGYRTIEFAEPVKLQGDSFVVVVEMTTNESDSTVLIESNKVTGREEAIINSGESFATAEGFTTNEWQDLALMSSEDLRGNACIKAFTVKEKEGPKDPENPDKPQNPDKPEEPDKPIKPEDKNPISSNFRNAIAKVTNIESYFYTDKAKDAYVKMKVKISNIKIGDEQDKYTYYYYLSDEQGEKNISDSNWKKVEAYKESDGTYSITVDVNTKNMNNVEKISQSDNMFIYIKEIAEINNKSKELIATMQVQKDSEGTIYLDDKKVDSIDVITKDDENKEDKKDDTIVPGKIPQTGALPIMIVSFMVISSIGAFAYYKYRKIDR